MIKKGIRIEVISILLMVIEAAVAIYSGVVAHSIALVAFGADSVIELVAGIALLWRLLIEFRSGDSEKAENAEKIASWIVGVALLLLGVYIAVSAIYSLITHGSAEESLPGIILAVAAGILMPVLAYSKRKIGRAIGSESLEADGFCSIVCAYMSWILIADVVLTAALSLWWLDSVISLVFIYFVVKEGLEAIREARGGHCSCGECGDRCNDGCADSCHEDTVEK